MGKTLLKLATMAAVLAGSFTSAAAHHSAARFNTSEAITIEGTVTRYDWANPHVYIYLEATGENGEVREWELEGQPPALLRRLGWSPETLRVGDRVSATGSPSRMAESNSLLLTSLQRGERSLFNMMGDMGKLAQANAPSGAVAESLDGTWSTVLAYQVVAPFAAPGNSFALTPAGTEAIAAYDEATMNPAIDCTPFGAPIAMVTPDIKRIIIGEDSIRIGGEYDGVERVIHMAQAPADDINPTPLGHSTGRWEGDTLVIDTSHFTPNRAGNGGGLPSGPKKHLKERFTPSADRTSLTYWFQLSDPDYLAEPVSGEVTWEYRPDLTYAPLACDPENARRFTEN